MHAQEYRSESGTLGGGFQGEPLRQGSAVLVVISDLEPWQATAVDGGLQLHATDPQHPGILESQCFLELVIGVDQQRLATMAASRGDIVFGATVAAHLEAKTKVTLLSVNQPLTAAAEVFDDQIAV